MRGTFLSRECKHRVNRGQRAVGEDGRKDGGKTSTYEPPGSLCIWLCICNWAHVHMYENAAFPRACWNQTF